MKFFQNNTRFLCLLMALVMTLPLASCGNTENTETDDHSTTTDTTPAETEPVDPLAHLPSTDYEGYDFRMQLRNDDKWVADQIAEEMTGEVVNDAVYKRNSETMDRYNIVISHTRSSNANGDMDAKSTIQAGDDAYDLIINHPRNVHSYANQGLARNWNDLTYVDLTKDYWDQDAAESFQMPGGLFCMTGYISHESIGATNAMLFNKDIFDDNGLDYPYETVKEGKWLLDDFIRMVETYSRDLDGDGEFTENDLYGYATHRWIGPIQAFYSSGARVIEKGSEDYAFGVFNEKSLTMFEKYFDMLDAPYAYLDTVSTQSIACEPIKMFPEEKAVFIDVNITSVLNMREMDANFGIIPWPKLEETDEYWSNVDAGTNMLFVPITVQDMDRTSLVLETLAILGKEYVVPAYYEVALKTRDSRDTESAEMLDIILANRVFDLGYYNTDMGGSYASHFADLCASTNRDFASWYDSKLKASESLKEKTLQAYEDRLG